MSGLSITADRAAIPGSAWTFQSALTLGALPTATPCARLHTRNVVREWGLRHLSDTIELVVSELVTNAVSASVDEDQHPHYTDWHGAACVRLRLSTDRRTVLVEVWDENVRPPEPNQAGLPGSAALVSRSVLPGVGQVRAVPSMRALLQVADEQVRAALITELTYLPQQGT